MTNYLSDEIETLKHEKILEEQLIKDFELMGSELELVDDSHQHQQSKMTSQTGANQPASPQPDQHQRRPHLSSSSNADDAEPGAMASPNPLDSKTARNEPERPASFKSPVMRPSKTTLVQTLVNDQQEDLRSGSGAEAAERRRQSSERRLLMDIEGKCHRTPPRQGVGAR